MDRPVKVYRSFVTVAGGILGATCLAKLVSVFGSAEALTLPDALFGVQNRWVMLLAAFAEAAILGILVSKVTSLTKLVCILWLSLNFAIYRICLWLIGVTGPCPCMGNAYELIGMNWVTMDRVLGGSVLVLLAGSGYLIGCHNLRNRRTRLGGTNQASAVANVPSSA